jgi:hypothetical protein
MRLMPDDVFFGLTFPYLLGGSSSTGCDCVGYFEMYIRSKGVDFNISSIREMDLRYEYFVDQMLQHGFYQDTEGIFGLIISNKRIHCGIIYNDLFYHQSFNGTQQTTIPKGLQKWQNSSLQQLT